MKKNGAIQIYKPIVKVVLWLSTCTQLGLFYENSSWQATRQRLEWRREEIGTIISHISSAIANGTMVILIWISPSWIHFF